MEGLSLNPSYIQARKLKAVWSVEAQQDLRSFHNLDAEQTLADIMAKEIQAEIDNEIIKDLAAAQNYPAYQPAFQPPQPYYQYTLPEEEPVVKKKEKPKYRSIDDDWQGEM
jgi:Mn-dependent DtxR family transcriptional regulator